MESQSELFDEIVKGTIEFQKELPAVMAAKNTFSNEVYQDGALSLKVKRLIALGIALRAGCPPCILAQTKFAAEAGASKAEVVETVSVSAAMGGTTTSSYSWMVLKLLKELGKW